MKNKFLIKFKNQNSILPVFFFLFFLIKGCVRIPLKNVQIWRQQLLGILAF